MRAANIERIKTALTASGGVLAVAARILGQGRSAVHEMVTRHPELREHVVQVKLDAVDLAEGRLIREATAPKGDWRASLAFLATQARDRGYGKQLVEVKDADEVARLENENQQLRRQLLYLAVDEEIIAMRKERAAAEAAERAKELH